MTWKLAEPAGARERDVVLLELLEHRGPGEAHLEAHAVQTEHDRGQREMVHAVEDPAARAVEREPAGLEAEEVEGEQRRARRRACS